MKIDVAIRMALAMTIALPVIGSGQGVQSQSAAAANASVSEAARVTHSVNAGSLTKIAHSQSALARRQAAVGAADDSIVMEHMQLVLKRSDQRAAALSALTIAQQDPRSPQFHNWLTAQEFGSRFGVVDQDIKAVTSWLRSEGFTVNGVYPNKMQIDFSGTVAKVNKTFHTQQMKYAGGLQAATHIANASDISIPAALSAVVAGVAGLSDVRPTAMHTKGTVSTKFTVNASRNAAKLPFATPAGGKAGNATAHGEAIPVVSSNGTQGRDLVPADMQTIYNTASLYKKGINGAGLRIALVEDGSMVPGDWYDFVNTFHLPVSYSQFSQINPAPPAGVAANCFYPGDATPSQESLETVLDAEWSTAMAPGANIMVAVCADTVPNSDPNNPTPTTTNFFGGMYLAALNVINSAQPPDILSASYGYGEDTIDSASKTQLDNMWQQAASEGISVFVSTGDSGSNPDFNGAALITAPSSVNGLATSPYVTAVGGTDFADMLDGTSANYFTTNPDYRYGTAKSYVPEIPWNSSCGNSVAAKASGFAGPLDFCNDILTKAGGPGAFFYDYFGLQLANPFVFVAEAGSGGTSTVNAKPSWQSMVYGAANDQSRDIPDVALYGGSFTFQAVVICTGSVPCNQGGFPNGVQGEAGTSLSSPMFAGIQALVDQAAHGKQGVAAPTLYALATKQYGAAGASAPPASLAACSSDNPDIANAGCVFHNVVRGGISTNCFTATGNCSNGILAAGLTSQATDGSFVEFAATPGWNIATGLGSVDAQNLANAWVSYVNQPPATN